MKKPLSNLMTFSRLIDFYESRRFTRKESHLEPKWDCIPYNRLYDVKAGVLDKWTTREVQAALDDLSYTGPVGNTYWCEDGFYVWSPSWVFMGRALKTSIVFPFGSGLVAVGRVAEERTLEAIGTAGRPVIEGYMWIVYSVHEPLHIRGVGPCSSHEEAMRLVPEEFPDQMPSYTRRRHGVAEATTQDPEQ